MTLVTEEIIKLSTKKNSYELNPKVIEKMNKKTDSSIREVQIIVATIVSNFEKLKRVFQITINKNAFKTIKIPRKEMTPIRWLTISHRDIFYPFHYAQNIYLHINVLS